MLKFSLGKKEMELASKAFPGSRVSKGSLVYRISAVEPAQALDSVRTVGDSIRKLAKRPERL